MHYRIYADRMKLTNNEVNSKAKVGSLGCIALKVTCILSCTSPCLTLKAPEFPTNRPNKETALDVVCTLQQLSSS